MAAQLGAIAASALLGVDVIIVVSNLFLSMRGAGVLARDRASASSPRDLLLPGRERAGRVASADGRQPDGHFTDWVVGHSHMAMLGFASFAATGGLVHAWQRIPWARYNPTAITWAYWLMVTGIVVMFVDLTIAGIVQGRLWADGAPWIDSVAATRPYWIVRALTGIPLAGAFIALLAGLTTGRRGAGLDALDARVGAVPATEVTPRLALASATVEAP